MQLTPHTAFATTLEGAGALLRQSHCILIFSHYRPDGDAIGSTLALANSLAVMGKTVVCLNQDSTPNSLLFLEAEGVKILQALPTLSAPVDLIVALDCASIERLGEDLTLTLPVAPVLTIDHHITNQHYGDHLLLDTKAAATGEILYELLSENKFPLPPVVRDQLYIAISTDTGSLQYSNATAKTYRIMSELVEKGVNVGRLNQLMYFNYSVRRVQILKECLNSFSLSMNGLVAHWAISHQLQAQVGVVRGDMEGLMDVLRGISGVQVCFTLEEGTMGVVRLSMRSKDPNVDVSQICAQFGGGGHKMAAGAALPFSLEKCEKQVLALLEKTL